MTATHISFMAMCKSLLAEMRANKGKLNAHVGQTTSSDALSLDAAFSALSAAAASR